jgi:hypothetical protein
MNHGAIAPRNVLRIRQLNDQFRNTLRGGRLVITSGINSLSIELQAEIMKAVVMFDDFGPHNDHGEHDFGSFKAGCGQHHIFWKIDLYDKEMRFASSDGSDPTKTTRVCTVMLASEY